MRWGSRAAPGQKETPCGPFTEGCYGRRGRELPGGGRRLPGLHRRRVRVPRRGDGRAGHPGPRPVIVTLKAGASTDATARKVRASGVRRFDGVLNGFAARLDRDQLAELRRDARVAAIEQDRIVSIHGTQRAPLPWGLDRIDQRSRKLSKSYTYKSTGKGVNAYVIDTGLDVSHKDFGGRAPSPGRPHVQRRRP